MYTGQVPVPDSRFQIQFQFQIQDSDCLLRSGPDWRARPHSESSETSHPVYYFPSGRKHSSQTFTFSLDWTALNCIGSFLFSFFFYFISINELNWLNSLDKWGGKNILHFMNYFEQLVCIHCKYQYISLVLHY